ncbi:hypothetical protein [Sphingobacterium suaedae]|uniref:Uncharacterized protein n=1 Tax=Sphingobacterium suaedae TaxID=1686402 RepID=A0ABW5KR08_9SPHI
MKLALKVCLTQFNKAIANMQIKSVKFMLPQRKSGKMKYIGMLVALSVTAGAVVAQGAGRPTGPNPPAVGRTFVDSVGAKVNVDSAKIEKEEPLPIPTARPKTQYKYNMPVKKLSGKGLALMPGTEPLDALEKKHISQDTGAMDTLKILKLLRPTQ